MPGQSYQSCPVRPVSSGPRYWADSFELRVSGGVGGWNGHGHGGRREWRPGPVTPVGNQAGSEASSGPGEPTRPARPQIWAGFLQSQMDGCDMR